MSTRTYRVMAAVVGAAWLLSAADLAHATPSTTYFTPATSDIQAFKVWHIGVDNYFRLYRTQEEFDRGFGVPAGNGAFPTDVGLTVGVLPFEKVQMEVGIDGLFPGSSLHPTMRSIGNSLLFNTKVGTPEGAFFGSWFPAINIGMFNIGTRTQVTDMNIVDLIVGKTLGPFGRIHAGGYYGNPGAALMRKHGCLPGNANPLIACNADPESGKLENSGGMVGYDYGFWKVKDSAGNEYNKWVLAADYASGKNLIGGGGFGMYHFFTKDISLLTGPVWFNDHVINGQWKWTVQLDINF